VTVVALDDLKNRTRTDADGRFTLSLDRRARIAALGDGWGWRSCTPPLAGELEISSTPRRA